MDAASEPVSSNGHEPPAPATEGPLDRLRATPTNVHLFRGFGPLVVGAVLFVLMVALAPSVAPERTVERPADGTSTTAEAVEPADDVTTEPQP